MKISVKHDVESFRQLQKLHNREVNKAAARALNRAIDAAATPAGRAVSAATKIKVRDVRARMTVSGANPDRLVAELTAHPYSPNLKAFRPSQNRKGVAASAWETRKTYQHAFIMPRSGKVVTRTTSKRTPLKGLRGPSVPRTFEKPQIMDATAKAAHERFDSEFAHEITRRLGE